VLRLAGKIRSGKSLLVWCAVFAIALCQITQRGRIGERSFIVGELAGRADGDEDQRVGLTFSFPVANVLMITEFPGIETCGRSDAKYLERSNAKTIADNFKLAHYLPAA
jgi:hypothetical protein